MSDLLESEEQSDTTSQMEDSSFTESIVSSEAYKKMKRNFKIKT